jgi:transposase InsO family protein
MRQLGLRSVLGKKFRVRTTDSNHNLPLAKNILDRNFTSSVLGGKWVSDITYVQVANQWNYLTTVLDLADRKVISWVLSGDMTTGNTVRKAYLKARGKKGILPENTSSIPTGGYSMLQIAWPLYFNQ